MNTSQSDSSNYYPTLGSGSVPGWWKAALVAIIGYAGMNFAYFHLGTPGRTSVDLLDAAMAKNMALQFKDIGELKQDAPTMVKFIDEPSWLSVGQSVFKANCMQCHGAVGEGKIGPNLGDEHYKNVRNLEDILVVINRGAGGNAMPAWQNKLNSNEIVLVATYVASLPATNPPNGKGPEGQMIPPWPTVNESLDIETSAAETKL